MTTLQPTSAGPNESGMGLNDNVYQRLLQERIIWLGGEVRDDSANAICAQLLLLAAENPDEDIYLYINSPGGSVTAGMAIYDTMQYVKPDIATVGMGLAASMGQFLLTAGTNGKRYITPHTRVLMHQPSGGAGGSATDIRINADLILHMKKELAEIMIAFEDVGYQYPHRCWTCMVPCLIREDMVVDKVDDQWRTYCSETCAWTDKTAFRAEYEGRETPNMGRLTGHRRRPPQTPPQR